MSYRGTNKDGMERRSSSSTGSFQKRMSDETDMLQLSSDEHPSSQEGDGSVKDVDNIVAAALAYAEKAHGEGGNPCLIRPPAAQRATTMKINLRRSTATDNSSSIHSFFTKSEGSQNGEVVGDDRGAMFRKSRSTHQHSGGTNLRGSHSMGNPQFLSRSGTAPVDDLVARAILQAQGELDSAQQRPHANEQQQQTRPSMSKMRSEYSIAHTVGSVYSMETEEFSNQGGVDYDC